MKHHPLVTMASLAILSLFLPAARAASASLATLNGAPITEEEVLKRANKRMMKILSEMYDVKKEVIDEIIDERLLDQDAKAKGLSVDALIKKATGEVVMPTDDEARTIYEMQKTRAFKGKEFEEVKDDIKGTLTEGKRRAAVEKYLSGLRGKAKVVMNIERPSVQVSADDDPAMGPASAPITLIEFSEFQCPFCKRARPTITKVLETYKDKVRYVFRDFPLNFHKDARPAANAANCADEQKKYWEYNKGLFENQGSLGDELYRKLASDLGLDSAAFAACYAARKYEDEIDKDQRDGMEVGVSGTPAYFINGKFLSGAQAFPAFQEIIDEELAKKGK